MARVTNCMGALLALAVCGGLPNGAHAQDSEYDARIERARTIFQRGEREFDERRFATAAATYREAYELMEGHPNQYVQLFNIGQAYAQAGSYEAAIEAYEAYLEEGGDRVQNRGEVEDLLVEYRERVATGRTDPPPPPDDGAPPPPPGPDGALLGTGIALAGLGALGLVAMGVLGGLALAEQGELACADMRMCTPEDIAVSNDLALGADISLIAGSVLAAAGVALIVVAMVTQPSADEPVAIAPFVTPDAAGVVGRASW